MVNVHQVGWCGSFVGQCASIWLVCLSCLVRLSLAGVVVVVVPIVGRCVSWRDGECASSRLVWFFRWPVCLYLAGDRLERSEEWSDGIDQRRRSSGAERSEERHRPT